MSDIPRFMQYGSSNLGDHCHIRKGKMNIMKKYLYIHKTYAKIIADGAVF